MTNISIKYPIRVFISSFPRARDITRAEMKSWDNKHINHSEDKIIPKAHLRNIAKL